MIQQSICKGTLRACASAAKPLHAQILMHWNYAWNELAQLALSNAGRYEEGIPSLALQPGLKNRCTNRLPCAQCCYAYRFWLACAMLASFTDVVPIATDLLHSSFASQMRSNLLHTCCQRLDNLHLHSHMLGHTWQTVSKILEGRDAVDRLWKARPGRSVT